MHNAEGGAAPAKRSDLSAQILAISLAFALPIFFLPSSWLPLSYGKLVLVALLAILPLVFWGYGRLKEGKLIYPNSYGFYLALLVPFVYLISALISGEPLRSLFGAGFETDSFFFVSLLFLIFVSVSLIFTSISSIYKALVALSSSFSFLFLLQFALFFFAKSSPVLLGSWNDMAVMAALVLPISLSALLLLNKKSVLRYLSYLNVALALFVMAAVNMQAAWISTALFSALFMIYFYVSDRGHQDSNTDSKSANKIVAPLAIFLLSLAFIFAGSYVSGKISSALSLHFIDVRPSWSGTIDVIKSAYEQNLLLGSGPNTFSELWSKYKPETVNLTPFWNVDFKFGVGFVPSAFATVGILGGLLWIIFLTGALHNAFRVLWSKMPNDVTRFAALASAGAALSAVVMLFLAVPQASVLALIFFILAVLLAVARNLNAVKTSSLSAEATQASRFVFVSIHGFAALVFLFFFLIAGQRVTMASYLQRSVEAFNASNFEKAEVLAQKAIKVSSFVLPVPDSRAYIVLAQNAGQKLAQAIAIKDKKSDEYKEKFKSAVEAFVLPAQQAVEKEPDNYGTHLLLGDVYAQLSSLGVQGAYEAALSAYKKAKELNPKNPGIALKMAQMAFANDKMDDAKKYAQEAVRLKRNYAGAYYLLSQVAIKEGSIKDAIASTESALLLSPNNTGLLFQLGVLHYSAKDYKKAERALARAVAINPNYANALYYLALAKVKQNDKKTAIALLEHVAKLNPDNKHVKELINTLKSGDLKEAPEPSKDNPKTPLEE